MGGRGSKMCPDCLTKNVQHFPVDQPSDAEKKIAVSGKQAETFQEDFKETSSDSRKKKTRRKHMQSDSDSDDDDGGRGGYNGPHTQVIESVGVMQFGANSKVITNNYNMQPKPKKKEGDQKKQLPSEITPDKSGDVSAKRGGAQFKNADGKEIPGLVVDMWEKAKKSVGIIRGPGSLQGTGFLLNDHSVMTAYHVIEDIVSENEEGKKILKRQHTEGNKISIQFGYQQSADTEKTRNYFYFTSDIQYENPILDVAVLTLQPDSSKDLPPPFKNFSPVKIGMQAHMIGHPRGGTLSIDHNIERFELSADVCRDAIKWSKETYGEDGYIGIQDSERILFHSRFTHGASGSPGCYTDITKDSAEVVWMLLEGYPGFYFKRLTLAQQKDIPDEFLIEQGITMEAIWKDMSKEKPDLCLRIFGPRDQKFRPTTGGAGS